MSKGNVLILALGFVLASIIYSSFNRYTITGVDGGTAYRVDKLTGHISLVRPKFVKPVAEQKW